MNIHKSLNNGSEMNLSVFKCAYCKQEFIRDIPQDEIDEIPKNMRPLCIECNEVIQQWARKNKLLDGSRKIFSFGK